MKYFSLIFVTWLLLVSCNSRDHAFESVIAERNTFSILISQGKIIDGTGSPAYQADILLRGDTIAYIGKVDTSLIEVADLIDASGYVVAPGFIDTHAHGNPLEAPQFPNFLAMGVTTIALGQDGSSPTVESLEQWQKTLTETGAGPNIILFVGHGTLRRESGIGYNKDPEEAQIELMAGVLEEAFQQGCWGMSTGLEYTPGVYATQPELLALAEVAGKYDRMIMSHIRNEDDNQLAQSIRELMQQGQHCRVHVSHMKSVYGKGSMRAREILTLLDSARQQNIQISADVYPYTASYTGIGIVFPQWALPPNDFTRVVRNRRQELSEYLRKRVEKRNGPDATLFGTAPYAGKTLAEVAKEQNKPFEILLIDDITPSGASAAYFVMDDELQQTLLTDSLTMICSDGSPTMLHPRGYGSFAKIIEQYVVKDSLFTLEQAIHKMTGLPANILQLPDRGIIEMSKKADIVIFKPEAIQAIATFENPHQLAKGFTYVLVNGHLVKKQDTIVKDLYGKFLPHPN